MCCMLNDASSRIVEGNICYVCMLNDSVMQQLSIIAIIMMPEVKKLRKTLLCQCVLNDVSVGNVEKTFARSVYVE